MNLTAKDMDALKELCNIGSGNALAALADFSNKEVDLYVPEAYHIPFYNLPEILGNEEDMYMLSMQRVANEDFNALALFLLDEASYDILIQTMLSQVGSEEISNGFFKASDFQRSIAEELSNVLTGNYLSAISDLLETELNPTPPTINYDMAGSLLNSVFCFYNSIPDNVLLIETKIVLDDNEICGWILFLPEKETLERIIVRMRELYEY